MEENEENTYDTSYYHGSFIIKAFHTGGLTMDEKLELYEDKEAYRVAKQLSELIKESNEYKYYRKCLAEIQSEPELYAQINELRRHNFELQNSKSGVMSYEQYADVSSRMTNLRKNPMVSRFFNSEIGIGRLMQNVYRQILEEVEFDISFLD